MKKKKASLAEIDKMIVKNSLRSHEGKGPKIGHTPISRSLSASITRSLRISKPRVGKMHGEVS